MNNPSNNQRNCSNCNKILTYNSKYACIAAETIDSKCKSCARSGKNNPMYGKNGNANPFYGKTHTTETKQTISEKRMINQHIYTSDEFITKMKSVALYGDDNPMRNPIVREIHLKSVNTKEYKELQSKLNSGKNNPMYGKPSPHGSGNGWSGWYNDWYFRSIKELSYMINVIERFKLTWKSAECSDLRIDYNHFNGSSRTYTADFLLNDKYLVEIKPKRLWESPTVKQKQNAALEFCNNNNLIYKLTDITPLTNNEIILLYTSNKIRFTKQYDTLFKIKYLNIFT